MGLLRQIYSTAEPTTLINARSLRRPYSLWGLLSDEGTQERGITTEIYLPATIYLGVPDRVLHVRDRGHPARGNKCACTFLDILHITH